MKLQAYVSKADFDQSIVNNREGCHLLCDEEYLFPILDGCRYDIRDGLRFTGSRRTLDHEIAPRTNFLNDLGL